MAEIVRDRDRNKNRNRDGNRDRVRDRVRDRNRQKAQKRESDWVATDPVKRTVAHEGRRDSIRFAHYCMRAH